MLARRFTIVCLLMTLFGMLFSILVAQAGRPERQWRQGVVSTCHYDATPGCISLRSR
ncbi:hypothetical protein [Pseudaminobacter sp. NGMCC 1.201702]|uniref:hypothetical protein n=1 Tax=Pseudaminobacter sp. NGMCC 1.201702 TaxID=3391825 RepID=UPI0039EFEC70